jgi:uncharacterized protein involved in outer membrane biogenesis
LSPAAPRRRRARALLAVLGLLAAAALGVVALLFGGIDANRYRDDVAAAVQRASGRDLLLEGDLSLHVLPRPTLRVEAARLANAPWGSRPWMLEAGLLEASIAPWPLLRGGIELERLVLTSADLLLETSPAGEPNWRFGRPEGADVEQAPGTDPAEGPSAAPLGLHEIVLREVRVAWRSGARAPSTSTSSTSPLPAPRSRSASRCWAASTTRASRCAPGGRRPRRCSGASRSTPSRISPSGFPRAISPAACPRRWAASARGSTRTSPPGGST